MPAGIVKALKIAVEMAKASQPQSMQGTQESRRESLP